MNVIAVEATELGRYEWGDPTMLQGLQFKPKT